MYVSSQDLLIVTDFASIVLLQSASNFIKMHKLRSIELYAEKRNELPGAHIISPMCKYGGDDIRLRSSMFEKSLHVGELIALSLAQYSVDTKYRRLLAVCGETEATVEMSDNSGTKISVGRRYYETLLENRRTDCYGGVYDNLHEPTTSWKSLKLSQKGIFFKSENLLYGLVMPRA